MRSLVNERSETAFLQHKQVEENSLSLNCEDIRERVAMRAYALYQQRGGLHGHHLDDWTQAEDEVLSSLFEQMLQVAERSRATSISRRIPNGSLNSIDQDKHVQRMRKLEGGKNAYHARS